MLAKCELSPEYVAVMLVEPANIVGGVNLATPPASVP